MAGGTPAACAASPASVASLLGCKRRIATIQHMQKRMGTKSRSPCGLPKEATPVQAAHLDNAYQPAVVHCPPASAYPAGAAAKCKIGPDVLPSNLHSSHEERTMLRSLQARGLCKHSPRWAMQSACWAVTASHMRHALPAMWAAREPPPPELQATASALKSGKPYSVPGKLPLPWNAH